MSSTTAERSLQVDGTQIRCLESGQGSTVVILRIARGQSTSPLQTLLAQHFRVVVLDIPERPNQEDRNIAHMVEQAALRINLDHYVLISGSDCAAAALWQAVDRPDSIDGLALISPMVLLPEGQTDTRPATAESALLDHLGEVRIATLILFGTNDTAIPPETGRMYVERLPDCYYTLVYDTGSDIEAERPQALYEAVCDFVERRGTFIVERNSTAINP